MRLFCILNAILGDCHLKQTVSHPCEIGTTEQPRGFELFKEIG